MQHRHLIALREIIGRTSAGPLSVRISGDCMAPHLIAGQRVSVRPRQWYWPGDILVFHSPLTNRLIAHRLIGAGWRQGRWRLLTQADTAPRPDIGLAPGQVLGRVVHPPVAPGQRLAAIGRFLSFVRSRLLHT